jgi:hypothetical protein
MPIFFSRVILTLKEKKEKKKVIAHYKSAV